MTADWAATTFWMASADDDVLYGDVGDDNERDAGADDAARRLGQRHAVWR